MISLFAGALASRLGDNRVLPTVPFHVWNERVRRAASAFRGCDIDGQKHLPSTKIQSVFDDMARVKENTQDEKTNAEAGGTARLSIIYAMQLSKNLRDVQSIGKEQVDTWVAYWKRNGLFG